MVWRRKIHVFDSPFWAERAIPTVTLSVERVRDDMLFDHGGRRYPLRSWGGSEEGSLYLILNGDDGTPAGEELGGGEDGERS